MKDFEKRFVTTDGKFRVTIYRDENAENPRDTTDEPVHFEDYSRKYTLMEREDREYQCHSLEDRACKLLAEYGDAKKIIDLLIENGKHLTDGKSTCNIALVYRRSEKDWVLKEYCKYYSEKEYNWKTIDYFYGKRKDLPDCIYEILEQLPEDCLEYLFNSAISGIKVATYNFGYYGSISFDEGIDFGGEGLCWIEKNEFLKYTGLTEKDWADIKLTENWLIQEIISWADGYVYGFTEEKRSDYNVTKVCTSEEKEDQTYNETSWDDTGNSCWGFYGELDEKQIDWILGEAGYKREDMTEVDE